MPSKKALDGEYRDIAHPINSATRERIQSTILEKYEESLEEEERSWLTRCRQEGRKKFGLPGTEK